MSSTSESNQFAAIESDSVPDDSSIADLLVILGEEKRSVLGITAVGLVLSLAIALLIPRDYTATTVIMPPQQPQQGGVMGGALAQLGALGSVAGASLKSPEEMYIAMLQSRSVQDALIKRFKLMERYDVKLSIDARKELTQRVTVAPSKKSGFIALSADDPDPGFAAELANAHVDELRQLLDRIAVTDAQQRRLFFEQQVKKTQARLNSAELQFRQAQAESGMVVSQALAESGVRESAELRGQIAAREVKLQTLSQFATAQHPDMQRIRAELTALRQQLSQLERGRGPNSDLTPHGIQAVKAFREMKVQEVLLETLIKQLEMARSDEAKEGPFLQQIDVAVPPERPSKPKRSMVVLAGLLGSLTLAVSWAIARRKLNTDSRNWGRIRAAWH